jgi:hypothetical protein
VRVCLSGPTAVLSTHHDSSSQDFQSTLLTGPSNTSSSSARTHRNSRPNPLPHSYKTQHSHSPLRPSRQRLVLHWSSSASASYTVTLSFSQHPYGLTAAATSGSCTSLPISLRQNQSKDSAGDVSPCLIHTTHGSPLLRCGLPGGYKTVVESLVSPLISLRVPK